MPAGDAFTANQVDSIERALEQANQVSGLTYSVFVGDPGVDLRAYGRQLLGSLHERGSGAVIVLVDPAARQLEIITGAAASRALDDRATALGAMSMTSSFAAGDLAGGIISGLHTLAEHGRQPRSLHQH